MKTGLGLFVLCSVVFLTHQGYAQETSDKIVENIKAVCLAPSEQGKYWKVEGAGQGKAKVTVKLFGELGGTGTVTLTQGEWEGVQQVLREKQADDNASYRACVTYLTPMFLENFVPKRSERPQSGTDKKSAAPSKKHNNAPSVTQQARDHNTQVGNNYGNVIINPDKDLTKNEPTIFMVYSSQNLLSVLVDSPPQGDGRVLVNDKDISPQLKSEITPQGMKQYLFEGSPDQLNLFVGKNKVVVQYGNTLLPAFEFKYTDKQKAEAQRAFDVMQRSEFIRKRAGH